MDKIKVDGKIERETNPDRRGPSQIGTVWHIPDPPTFSLPTTFKYARFSIQELGNICKVVFAELLVESARK